MVGSINVKSVSQTLTVRGTNEEQNCYNFSDAPKLPLKRPEIVVTFSLPGTNFQVVCTDETEN